LRELSSEELKVILLHEFAHLRRMDDWTNLAQQLVRTIFFFHPAVIWIGTRLSLEREMACDDVVLAETGNPRAYAECLVKIAEKTLVGRALAMGQAVISHARQTCQRLGRILDVDRATSASTCKPALGISIFLVVFCLVALPRVPKLVVVDNTGRTPVVTSATDIAPRAAVIPAVARLVSGSAFMPVASSDRTVAANRPHRFVQTVSRRKRSHPRQSLFARAVARQTSRPVELVVFTRTTEFEASGSAIMTISVWRVTLVRPNRATTGVARSI
jgi:hypothetical protein